MRLGIRTEEKNYINYHLLQTSREGAMELKVWLLLLEVHDVAQKNNSSFYLILASVSTISECCLIQNLQVLGIFY